MTISGLSDTGVSPGRRFQPLILGLAVAIWALTHFTGHDSRDPSGLTLAHQPGHSSASGSDRNTGALLPLVSRRVFSVGRLAHTGSGHLRGFAILALQPA